MMTNKKKVRTRYSAAANPDIFTWDQNDDATRRLLAVVLSALREAGGAHHKNAQIAQNVTDSIVEEFFPQDHVFFLNVRVSGSTTLKDAYAKLLCGMTQSKLDWISETAWDHHGNEVSEEALQIAAVAALEDAQREEA